MSLKVERSWESPKTHDISTPRQTKNKSHNKINKGMVLNAQSTVLRWQISAHDLRDENEDHPATVSGFCEASPTALERSTWNVCKITSREVTLNEVSFLFHCWQKENVNNRNFLGLGMIILSLFYVFTSLAQLRVQQLYSWKVL